MECGGDAVRAPGVGWGGLGADDSVPLFDVVVRGFAGDDHVVDVGFAQAGVGDADEARFLWSSSMVAQPQIAHAGAQAADELVDHGFERPAIGHAAFDAFGNELGEAVAAVALAVDDALVALPASSRSSELWK